MSRESIKYTYALSRFLLLVTFPFYTIIKKIKSLMFLWKITWKYLHFYKFIYLSRAIWDFSFKVSNLFLFANYPIIYKFTSDSILRVEIKKLTTPCDKNDIYKIIAHIIWLHKIF